jgi:hypothetical protein
VPTQSKVGVYTSLDCRDLHLGEPRTVGLGEQLVGDVDQCVAPPEVSAFIEQGTGPRNISDSNRLMAKRPQTFEPKYIDRLSLHRQCVAAAFALNGVGSTEHSPQRRDPSLEGVRAVRRMISPQDLGQAVVAYYLSAAQCESDEQRG